ncbi:MAG: thymidine phosphorylase [Defluviitaleaceae bacterium]|nr:thymidine phosphorylase [Defluviitaleaceae bacterium]
MRIYEIITKKKRGEALSGEEIRAVITGFASGEIPDYQISALLMAIYFRGMNAEETAALTMAMVDSGERVDLTPIKEKDTYPEKIITVDKHSTGGVGDKTTLAVVPIVAACGVPIAKMSGRGLGHTGGTIDKLEAIPGFRTNLSGAKFMDIVKNIGLCIAGQSANLAPADKGLYALRDVTATVDSIPLIAASIMSKKIAAGADAILLDVKTGSGAFMKNLEDARKLAQTMVEIGNNCGRKTAALITDMSAPLGYAIGNSLELLEVAELLSGKLNESTISKNLLELCVELSANMLVLAEKGSLDECRILAKEAISSGKALQKLAEMVEAQGGDRSYIENSMKLNEKHTYAVEIPSPQNGYITVSDTEGIGLTAMSLGAGRTRPEDKIDHSAGIILNFTSNSYVEKGQTLAYFYTSARLLAVQATEQFLSSLTFSNNPVELPPLIYEHIF